jgi:hypothetical protein
MFGYRIQTNEINKSFTVKADINAVGAMVVRSSRGPSVPKKFSTARDKEIKAWFGEPTLNHPDIWEALCYNEGAPLWVVCPKTAEDRLGGVIVSSGGVFTLIAPNPATPQNPNQITDGTSGLEESDLSSFEFDSEVNDYFLLLDRSASAVNHLNVKIFKDNDTNIFTVELYSDETGKNILYGTYNVSLDPNAVGDFGKSIYIGKIFEDHPLIQVVVNTKSLGTGAFVNTADRVVFTGATKGIPLISEVSAAWDYFKQSRQFAAKIFMDVTTDPLIAAKFDSLRRSFQKYSSYILAIPSGKTTAEAILAYQGLSLNNRGLAIYYNHGLIDYKGDKKYFKSPLVGKIGYKYAQMVNVYNGLAPYGVDENFHGGQLGSGIAKMEYDPSDDELAEFEKAGINPIIFDPIYGVTIQGGRTCASPGTISDDSFISHSRMFDYLIENTISQVLVFQVAKLNDDQHRRSASLKGRGIVKPVADAGLLREYRIQCDGDNNDDDVLALHQFVYALGVKVTPQSEWIIFNFVKVGQNISVTEALKG